MQGLSDSMTRLRRFAMQKVVGSSPIIRSSKPRLGGVLVYSCLRDRPAARQGEPIDSATSHIGFRCNHETLMLLPPSLKIGRSRD
jgi:hypothetical protein